MYPSIINLLAVLSFVPHSCLLQKNLIVPTHLTKVISPPQYHLDLCGVACVVLFGPLWSHQIVPLALWTWGLEAWLEAENGLLFICLLEKGMNTICMLS